MWPLVLSSFVDASCALWMIQSASTSGVAKDALRTPREVGGTYDVTIESNRVNLQCNQLREQNYSKSLF